MQRDSQWMEIIIPIPFQQWIGWTAPREVSMKMKREWVWNGFAAYSVFQLDTATPMTKKMTASTATTRKLPIAPAVFP